MKTIESISISSITDNNKPVNCIVCNEIISNKEMELNGYDKGLELHISIRGIGYKTDKSICICKNCLISI